MKNKIFVILVIALLTVPSGAAFAAAPSAAKVPAQEQVQQTAPANDHLKAFNSAAARGSVLFSVPYGEKDNEMTRSVEDAQKGSVMSGPSAFAADAAGNVYVVDAAKRKVIRFDAASKKAVMLFNYEKSDIKTNFVSAISVAKDGHIYLGTASDGEAIKFDASGKQVAVNGYDVERQVIKGLAATTAGDDGGLAMADHTEFKVALFDAKGKFVREHMLKEAPNGLVHHAGKFYAAFMTQDEVVVANAANSAEVIVKYPTRSKDGSREVAGAELVGIDAAGCAYLHVAVVEKDGKVVENDVIKFAKDGVMSNKVRVPYYALADDDINIARAYVLLKENVILSYDASDDREFRLVTFEMKK